MADMVKTCKDCKKEFTITADNQRWYESKGFNLPERCPDCRKKRKAAKQHGGK